MKKKRKESAEHGVAEEGLGVEVGAAGDDLGVEGLGAGAAEDDQVVLIQSADAGQAGAAGDEQVW